MQFSVYDIILPMTPSTHFHPNDVTILFFDYDVIILVMSLLGGTHLPTPLQNCLNYTSSK